MNGKDLLISLGNINPRYYEEAENDMLSSGQPRRTLRRPLLVAALIAVMLLLVGCAVVYALRLQDMSIGQETYTQTFDEQGKYLDEPVEKTRDILTLFGHNGDHIQKATAEWFAFLETYDPDGELMDNNPDHAKIPNQYEYTYGCYTTDMVAKVDELAAKYDLKLLDTAVAVQAWQSDVFCSETGIGSLLLPGKNAQIERASGTYYPPYNIGLDFTMTTDFLDTRISGTFEYARKDYFPSNLPGGMDLNLYTQWDYTSSDGSKLLLALSDKGSAYIIAEKEEAMIIVYLYGNFSGSAYPSEEEILTKAELESLAGLFDYSIQPIAADMAVLEEKFADAEAAYQKAHTYEPVTYGSYSEYLKKTFVVPDDDLQYTFQDLDNDGSEELLIGRNGGISYWVSLRNGEIQEKYYDELYLCEGGVIENYTAYEIYETHSYYHQSNDPQENGLIPEEGGLILSIRRERDQWTKCEDYAYYDGDAITEAEAQRIISQYPRISLDWTPLSEYLLSEDQNLQDYQIAQDVRISDEKLMEIYKTQALKSDIDYTHYRLLDINGDGVKDLLRKGAGDSYIGKTDYYWSALTYRYGQLWPLYIGDFYLCEDGILEIREDRYPDAGVEVECSRFVRLSGFEIEELDFVAYNKATASWQGDWWGEKLMTKEEAEAILAKYSRVDQGMRPISELLN